jgi:hypothetical protein
MKIEGRCSHVLVKSAGQETVGQAVLDLISRGKLNPSTLQSTKKECEHDIKIMIRSLDVIKEGSLHGDVVEIASSRINRPLAKRSRLSRRSCTVQSTTLARKIRCHKSISGDTRVREYDIQSPVAHEKVPLVKLSHSCRAPVTFRSFREPRQSVHESIRAFKTLHTNATHPRVWHLHRD